MRSGGVLTVLSVAFPFAPVGPDAAGGAEQVLGWLDEALVRAGHRSIVVAAEGSRPAGRLHTVPAPAGGITDASRRAAWERHRLAVEEELAGAGVDLVHCHGLDFPRYLPPCRVPVLVTLHLPPGWYEPEVFRPAAAGAAAPLLVCVSASQLRSCPPGAPRPALVPNGVPVGRLQEGGAGPPLAGRGYALALGRICPEKNQRAALEAGRLADFEVVLAGAVFPYEAHERYFLERVLPGLDARRRFVGPVGFAAKRRLLAGARCLLLPSLAAETSSLTAMEALACGTPVVAYPAGALPEIVEEGRTGFLVEDEEGLARAIGRAAGLDPEVCRETARRRFPLERMTGRYLELYRALAGE